MSGYHASLRPGREERWEACPELSAPLCSLVLAYSGGVGSQCRSLLALSWEKTTGSGQWGRMQGVGPQGTDSEGGNCRASNLADKFWDKFCPLLPGRKLSCRLPGLTGLSICS